MIHKFMQQWCGHIALIFDKVNYKQYSRDSLMVNQLTGAN